MPSVAVPSSQPDPIPLDRDRSNTFVGFAERVGIKSEQALIYWLEAVRYDPNSTRAMTGLLTLATQGENLRNVRKQGYGYFQGLTLHPLLRPLISSLIDAASAPRNPEYAANLIERSSGVVDPAVLGLLGKFSDTAIRNSGATAEHMARYYMRIIPPLRNAKCYAEACAALDFIFPLVKSTHRGIADLYQQVNAQADIARRQPEGKPVEAGDFRANIRDPEAQARAEAEDRLILTAAQSKGAIDEARREYESNPSNGVAIKRYCEQLVKRGTDADLETAEGVLTAAFEAIRDPLYRRASADLRFKRDRKLMAEMEKSLNTTEDPALRTRLEALRCDYNERRLSEFELRHGENRLDPAIKFAFGDALLANGQYRRAAEMLESLCDNESFRARAFEALIQSYAKLGWYDEIVVAVRMAFESGKRAQWMTDVAASAFRLLQAAPDQSASQKQVDAATLVLAEIRARDASFNPRSQTAAGPGTDAQVA